MKKLEETYVIIERYEGSETFFKDCVCFEKEEANVECERLNKERNDSCEAYHNKSKKKNKGTYRAFTFFEVVNLKEAVKLFQSDTIDMWSTEDESR